MGDLEIQLLQAIGWAGVAALLVWKVLAPLTISYISKRPVNGNGMKALHDKVDMFERNHIHDVKESVKRIEKDVYEIKKNQSDFRERLVRVETKLNNK